MKLLFSTENVYVFQNTWILEELEALTLRKLNVSELEKYFNLKNHRRKSEWLAVRWLVYIHFKISSEIRYTAFGKPYLFENSDFSVSHSGNLIALQFGQNSSVDIEPVSQKMSGLTSKFISNSDLSQIQTDFLKNYALQWSAKEVLYKLYEKGNLIFVTDLKVAVPEKLFMRGVILCRILKDDFDKEILLNYAFIDVDNSENILVWVNSFV